MRPRSLPDPDKQCLAAAIGWLELGNPEEAAAELEKIAPEFRANPDVLEVRCQIYFEAGRLDHVMTTAETLVQQFPHRLDGWLYRSRALHELTRSHEAAQKLAEALATELSSRWEVKYALAQYSTQAGLFRAAYDFLRDALDSADSPDLQTQALNDPLLWPLWAQIEKQI